MAVVDSGKKSASGATIWVAAPKASTTTSSSSSGSSGSSSSSTSSQNQDVKYYALNNGQRLYWKGDLPDKYKGQVVSEISKETYQATEKQWQPVKTEIRATNAAQQTGQAVFESLSKRTGQTQETIYKGLETEYVLKKKASGSNASETALKQEFQQKAATGSGTTIENKYSAFSAYPAYEQAQQTKVLKQNLNTQFDAFVVSSNYGNQSLNISQVKKPTYTGGYVTAAKPTSAFSKFLNPFIVKTQEKGAYAYEVAKSGAKAVYEEDIKPFPKKALEFGGLYFFSTPTAEAATNLLGFGFSKVGSKVTSKLTPFYDDLTNKITTSISFSNKFKVSGSQGGKVAVKSTGQAINELLTGGQQGAAAVSRNIVREGAETAAQQTSKQIAKNKAFSWISQSWPVKVINTADNLIFEKRFVPFIPKGIETFAKGSVAYYVGLEGATYGFREVKKRVTSKEMLELEDLSWKARFGGEAQKLNSAQDRQNIQNSKQDAYNAALQQEQNAFFKNKSFGSEQEAYAAFEKAYNSGSLTKSINNRAEDLLKQNTRDYLKQNYQLTGAELDRRTNELVSGSGKSGFWTTGYSTPLGQISGRSFITGLFPFLSEKQPGIEAATAKLKEKGYSQAEIDKRLKTLEKMNFATGVFDVGANIALLEGGTEFFGRFGAPKVAAKTTASTLGKLGTKTFFKEASLFAGLGVWEGTGQVLLSTQLYGSQPTKKQLAIGAAIGASSSTFFGAGSLGMDIAGKTGRAKTTRFIGNAIDFPYEISGDLFTTANIKARKSLGLFAPDTGLIISKVKGSSGITNFMVGLPSNAPTQTTQQNKAQAQAQQNYNSLLGVQTNIKTPKVTTTTKSQFSSFIPNFNPSYVPSNVPSQVPSEVPPEIPPFVPENVPPEVPTEVPTDILSQVPINANIITPLWRTPFPFIPLAGFGIGQGAKAGKTKSKGYINELDVSLGLLKSLSFGNYKTGITPKIKKTKKSNKKKNKQSRIEAMLYG